MIKSSILILAALLPLSAIATEIQITVTRAQASDLYVALSSADSGLSPGNAVAAADNINQLRPLVEALDKGKVAYQRSVQKLLKANPADADAQLEKLSSELEAKADESFTLKLAALSLSDEELAATKIKPAMVAALRRWLLPPTK